MAQQTVVSTDTFGEGFTKLNENFDENYPAIALNTTHRTSDGTDHSYIDQSVTTTATPTFGSVTITNDLTVDTDTLYVDSTNHRVGINTTSPDIMLDVYGTNTEAIRMRGSTPASQITDFYVGSQGQFTIDCRAGTGIGYLELRPASTDFGFILRDSTGVTTAGYANFFYNNVATDYLNIVVKAGNSTPGFIIDENQDVFTAGNFTVTGDILPETADTSDIGKTDNRWANVYITGGSLHIGEDGNDTTIAYSNVTGTPVYLSGQSGLDDLSTSGTYTDTDSAIFEIECDSFFQTPDTFRWRKNSGSWTEDVDMTGSPQLLSDGISVTWGATIGHSQYDAWLFGVGYRARINAAIASSGVMSVDDNLFVSGSVEALGTLAVAGGLEIINNHMSLPDDSGIKFGDSDIFIITHDGTDTLMAVSSGDLTIENTALTGSIINKLGTDDGDTSFKVTNSSDGSLLTVTGAGLVSATNDISMPFGKSLIIGMTDITPYMWCPFNESSGTNAPDISGNNRVGTTQNMEDGDWQAGKLSNCLVFDGSNESVNYGDVADWERTQAFSVECWFKTSNVATNTAMISKMLSSGSYRGWALDARATGAIMFQLINTSGANQIKVETTATGFNDGSWHHVVATYDGSSSASGCHIYIDNTDESLTVTTDTLSATILNTADMNIASRNDGGSYYEGSIDEPLLFDQEVDSTYVNTRWNGGAGTASYPDSGSIISFTNDAGIASFNFNGYTDQFELKRDGTINVGTTNYELLVTSDNIIPNKKYVDDAVGGEDHWDRAGTVLSPTNAGDDVTTTGDISGAAGFFTGNLNVGGDMSVSGTITSSSTENLLVSDNHILLNNGYQTVAAKAGGVVVNYLPTSTVDTVSSGAFVAGIDPTSNPTVTTVGAAVFSQDDIIMINASADNDGLYEVHSHTSNLLTVRGVGSIATVEEFTNTQFVADASDNATITKVTVAVLCASTSGVWRTTKGSTTGLTFSDVNYWDRTGTVLSPITSGDDITTTGDISGAAGNFTGDVNISNGNGLVIGHSSGIFASDTAEFQVLGTGVADTMTIIGAFSNDSSGPFHAFVKSRNTTIGSHTIVQDDDELGGLYWLPDDGTDFNTLAARFVAEVDDSTPADGDIGTAFVWTQNSGGGVSVRETMRLTASGNLQMTDGGGISTTGDLYVNGAWLTDGLSMVDALTVAIDLDTNRTSAGNATLITFYNEATPISEITSYLTDYANKYGELRFSTKGSGGSADRLTIDEDGNINISGLTASLGVYTDSSKNLTSTPPTSGTLGYWDRTGTVLSPVTSGDDVAIDGDVIVANGAGLIIGNNTQIFAGSASELQVLGTSSGDTSTITASFSNDSSGPNQMFVKSRNTTIGSHTIVQDGDELGSVCWMPDDGIDFNTLSARFKVEVDDASPADGDIGAAFVWEQLPGGGGGLTETMRLAADGTLTTDLNTATTGVTQSPNDNSTKIATTAYVDTAVTTVDTWDEVMHNGNSFTVLDTENLSVEINQNDVTNNPDALVITNTGTGNDITAPNFSLKDGSPTFTDSATFYLNANEATAQTLSFVANNSGAGAGNVSMSAAGGLINVDAANGVQFFNYGDDSDWREIAFYSENTGAGTGNIVFDAYDDIIFQNDSTERMKIDAIGNVDITKNLTVNESYEFFDGSNQIQGSTPEGYSWHVSSGEYKQSFDTTTQSTSPHGLYFKYDGFKMYVLGRTTETIFEYDLSVAWDVTTAVYSTKSFTFTTQDDDPSGITFRLDGLKLYLAGNETDSILEYNLSTAWDVSTLSYVQSFSVTTQEDTPRDVAMSTKGHKMYVVGVGSDSVHEYDLSTPWDISSAVFNQSFSVSTQDDAPHGVIFKPNGTAFYVIGNQQDGIYEYHMATPWDISTAVYSQRLTVTSIDNNPTELYVSPDGSKLYYTGNENGAVYEFDLGVQAGGGAVIGGDLVVDTNAFFVDVSTGKVGIGDTAVSAGDAKFFIKGADDSNDGPHIQVATDADGAPLWGLYNRHHDDIAMTFDAWRDGGTYHSSDTGSNFGLLKTGDAFSIVYDSGIAVGFTVTWNTALSVNTSGDISIPNGTLTASLNTATTGVTQSPNDNSTKIATTAYVDAAVAVEDLWDRVSTTLSPSTSGDDISTSGDIYGAAGTFTGNGTFGASGNTVISDNGLVNTSTSGDSFLRLLGGGNTYFDMRSGPASAGNINLWFFWRDDWVGSGEGWTVGMDSGPVSNRENFVIKSFYNQTIPEFMVTKDGKVAINKETPTVELDLVGDAAIDGDLTTTGDISIESTSSWKELAFESGRTSTGTLGQIAYRHQGTSSIWVQGKVTDEVNHYGEIEHYTLDTDGMYNRLTISKDSTLNGTLDIIDTQAGDLMDALKLSNESSTAGTMVGQVFSTQSSNIEKAGIFFENVSGDANGRGTLFICNDIVDDTNPVQTGDAVITITADKNVALANDLTLTSGNFNVSSNKYLNFGDSNELQVNVGVSDSAIACNTGDFYIETYGGDFEINSDADDLWLTAYSGGAYLQGGTVTIQTYTGQLILDNTVNTSEIIARLGSNDGATSFQVQNNSESPLFSVAGDGYIVTTGSISTENIRVKRITFSSTTNTSTLGDAGIYSHTGTGTDHTLTISTSTIALGSTANPWPITIKDEGGGAASNNITIDTEGSQKIDGEDTVLITDDFGHVNLYSDGSNLYHVAGGSSFANRSYAISDYGNNNTFYAAGYYEAPASSVTLNTLGTTTQVFGTASKAEGAHAFAVFSVGGGADLVLTVTGTSITDAGVRTTSDSEVITSGTVLTDFYVETSKKWLGQVTYTISTTGTDGTYVFNYGFAKYEDFGNRYFTVTDFEMVGLSNLNAADLNITLLHHKTTGWTYHATVFVPGSTAICDMVTDYSTDVDLVINENFAYKRAGLSTVIEGNASEGVMVRLSQTTNNAIRYGTIQIGVLI